LIDTDHAVIMDVETTTVISQAEVLAAKRMLDRTHAHFGVHLDKLIADTGYGSAEMLGWLVEERGIAPHIPVFDKSTRTDGSLSRADFIFDPHSDSYICPAGKSLKHYRRTFHPPRAGIYDEGYKRYRASKVDCDSCALKQTCTPKEPARKILRSIHEPARDVARQIAKSDQWIISRRLRKKVEMLFAHLKRILKLDRLRLRGPKGARDEFHLAATAQNLRKLAKLIPIPIPARAS
jgi:Transposase DDE domain